MDVDIIINHIAKYNTIDPLLAKKKFEKSLYDASTIHYHKDAKHLVLKHNNQYHYYFYYYYTSTIEQSKYRECYGCCSSIRKGHCVGCSDRQNYI